MTTQLDLLSAGGSVECGICLGSFHSDEAFVLCSCAHSLHRPCLRDNVNARLRSGESSFTCFESGCGLPILDSDLSALLDDEAGREMMKRLVRRRIERSDPSVRFCPGVGCEREVRGGSEAAPELTCASCGKQFCFLHTTAHAPGRVACAAYAQLERESPEYAASLAAISKNSRKCPNGACGTLVERAGGCNSIVCSRCGTTFCWLCGIEITPGELPIHYQVSPRPPAHARFGSSPLPLLPSPPSRPSLSPSLSCALLLPPCCCHPVVATLLFWGGWAVVEPKV
jgi:hypothetical protein